MKKAGLVITMLIICGMLFGCSAKSNTIVVGAKDYTEQFILGNLLAILIEENTNINVTLTTDLASDVIFAAVRTGAVDVYVEYTGTVYGSYLVQSETGSAREVYDLTSRMVLERYDLHMLNPLGFNNSYNLAVRFDTANEYGLRTLSDLAEVSDDFVFGGSIEFLTRNDGFPNMKLLYDMSFLDEKIIDGTRRYTAINNDDIQVTEAFSTDGHLLAHALVVLEDDKNYFQPYQGVIMVRGETLENNTELRAVLEKLSGLISDDVMRTLNYRVDVHGESPEAVARSFLIENNLISR